MKRKLRKIFTLLIAAALLCAGMPDIAQAASFSDVPQNAWYKSYVYDLVDKGVISGTSPTKFSPNQSLTRGAFVTMLARTVLTDEEVKAYSFQGDFKDVAESSWVNPYVNWASENEVVGGYQDKTFRPGQPVSRQEMAVMVVNFANAVCRNMQAVNQAVSFTDQSSISKYAITSVQICQQAGIISGYKNGTFKPNGLATRAEAAALYSNFLKNCQTGNYAITRKRILGTAVRAVEFDSAAYSADLVMGRDVTDGSEAPDSMVSRSGASIAVNGAFFDMDTYLPVGTLIKQGRMITLADWFAPETPSFTEDPAGTFSIQNFSTSYTATLHKADGTETTLQKLGFNTWPTSQTDATRILFTRDWGHELCFTAKDAVVIDETGVITAVVHDQDVAIPEKGYVLAQRARRWQEGDFFDSCQVGEVIDIQRVYTGASSQDITLSVAAGPRLVKGGEAYGNTDTYKAEGFQDPNIISYAALRVCIGIKKDGHIVIASAYTTLPQLSKIMVALGCEEAMNLDGGGSTNLYVDGHWLRGPQDRALNNMLIFREK